MRWLRRGDRGAVTVEAALITPLLITLAFGIIEFGLFYKDSIVVTSMVRTGARTMSAEPRQSQQFSDAVAAVTAAVSSASAGSVQELWIYEAGSNGFPTGYSNFNTCSTTKCVRYTWNGTGFTSVSGYSWSVTTQNACPNDSAHTSVGIYIKASHHFLTGLFPGTWPTSDHAVMRFEPIPVAIGCK